MYQNSFLLKGTIIASEAKSLGFPIMSNDIFIEYCSSRPPPYTDIRPLLVQKKQQQTEIKINKWRNKIVIQLAMCSILMKDVVQNSCHQALLSFCAWSLYPTLANPGLHTICITFKEDLQRCKLG